MSKILKFFIVLVMFHACSYEPMLSKKNYDFEFDNIISSGESKINEIIKKNLETKTNGKKKFNIYYETRKSREIVSSNSKGDPKNYKLQILLNYEVSINGESLLKDKILKQTTYNNISDKYELSQYEDNIIQSLSKNISDEILFSLKTVDR